MTILSETKTKFTLVTSECSCTEIVQFLSCHLLYYNVFYIDNNNSNNNYNNNIDNINNNNNNNDNNNIGLNLDVNTPMTSINYVKTFLFKLSIYIYL